MDKPYKFRFYRRVTNGVGKSFDSTVEIVEIHRAKSEERARQAAILRFARHQRVLHWDSLASGYEVTPSRSRAAIEIST